MKLSDNEKQIIQRYGQEYLSKGDVNEFLNQIYSHCTTKYKLGSTGIDIDKVITWLQACGVEVDSNYNPTFICDGQDDNMCPQFANTIDIVGENISNYTFYKCENIPANIDIPDSIKEVEFGAFSGCKNLKSVKLPSQIRMINFDTFKNCSSLESVIMPSVCTYIGAEAFLNCGNLKTVDKLENVTVISGQCFYDCSSLDNIKLGEVDLGEQCFAGCKNLKNLEIGAMTNRISSKLKLFDGCTSLKQIKTRSGKVKAYVQKYYPEIQIVK